MSKLTKLRTGLYVDGGCVCETMIPEGAMMSVEHDGRVHKVRAGSRLDRFTGEKGRTTGVITEYPRLVYIGGLRPLELLKAG